MRIKHWVSVAVLSFSFLCSMGVSAKKVSVIASLPKPPFIIEENGKGLQLELMREALAHYNIDVEFYHAPGGRNITAFQRLNADVILNVRPDYQYPALYLSKPYVNYQNVAISLAENNFMFNSVEGLTNKVVVAFQNAKRYLDQDYNSAIDYVIDYREIPDQKKQVEMLFLRRAEVIIIDIAIFNYYLKHFSNDLLVKPHKVHYLFEKSTFSAAFKSEKLRDDFDKSIDTMRKNGRYQKIINQYIQ
ncbi:MULTISPECIES: substrate-binding periplasmic protein [Thalassotalea]|uniref:substrate-binding periplasmic protein n=1 Tax=Thalassotalea TaxID=1518149 RepID=UPI000941F223|nr:MULTISPECIES: transporter substrate-binding domain-containing protein [Thalassotalea]OKY28014.1 hypothetical protein BI291_06580 [Thalassotalea sp. PP2-459]